MAVIGRLYIPETHNPYGTNLDEQQKWLACLVLRLVVRLAKRRAQGGIMRLVELSSVVRLDRRTTEHSSTRCIIHFVPVSVY